jgi:signal peptidase II
MQAARGTPVGTTTRGGSRRFLILFGVVAALAYTVDQVTKAIAVAELDGRPDVQVVGELLQLNLVRNPGAAFSLGTGVTPLLSAVAVVATVLVLWFARRLGSTAWSVALGLLLAGVVGNLTDRVLRPPAVFEGHVIDFLQLPNWPVFNVADICINVAAGLIILQALRGVRLDGTRDGEAEEPDEHDEPGAATDDSPAAPADGGEPGSR